MPYSRAQLAEISKSVGRNWRTLQRWAAEGCRLEDPQSLKAFLTAKELKRTNIARSSKRRGIDRQIHIGRNRERTMPTERQAAPQGRSQVINNGETLPPPGRRGAAAALERLERQEEESFRRLEFAQQHGDRFEIDAAQTYWLKCSETLRRLDLAVEVARRDAEEQVPKRLASDVALYISDWFRISFMIFLSSESRTLMGIKDTGEWKNHAVQAFKSILHLTVRNSLKTQSPIPDWGSKKSKNRGTCSECAATV